MHGIDYLIFKHYHFHISASGGKSNGYYPCVKKLHDLTITNISLCKISKLFLRTVGEK